MTDLNKNTKEYKLAYEIASTLNDMDSLPLHLSFAHKYQEAFLRRILNRVMSLSDNQIKRTRGALFTYLVNQNGQNNSRY